MNERIRELALQANPASKEIYESDNWEYNCAAWCAQDLEKFAELIVRECVKVMYNNAIERQVPPDINQTPTHYAVAVLEHFGVEE